MASKLTRRVLDKGKRKFNVLRSKGAGIRQILMREGDTVHLMNALKRIDLVEGALTKSELKTAWNLTKKIAHKAAVREVEILFGKPTKDIDYEQNRSEVYLQLVTKNRKSLLKKLKHRKELTSFSVNAIN